MRALHRHLLAVAALIVLVSCGSPSKPSSTTTNNPPATPTVSLNLSSQAAPVGGGTFTISITSNGAWTVTSNASWVTVSSAASGSGNGTATCTVATNTGAARAATVTVTSGSASARVDVNQDGVSGPPPSQQLSVDPTSQTVAPGGESRTVAVTATVAWNAASDASWLTITSGASGSGNGTIGYAAAANTGIARTAHIAVTGGGLTATTTVNQDAPNVVPQLSLSPASQTVAAGGESRSVALTSNVAWAAVSDSPWLTITSAASGSGNGTIAYTAAANGTAAARTGRITVTGGGQTATHTVNQGAGAGSSLTVTPPTQSVAASGGSQTATVTASVSWTATSDSPWLVINSGASGSGNGTIAYSAAANTGGARSAVITVTGGGITATHTVNQAGVGASLTVTPPSDTVAVGGESKTATVTANVSWTASSNQSWLTITSGASGSGNGTIAYTAAANTGGARSAVITVTGGGITATHTVNQAGVGPSLTVTPPAQSVAVAGESRSAAVTANIGWTASSDSPWLTITSGASGSGNGTIAYTAAANTGNARTAVITVSGSGLTATHTVSQPGVTPSLAVTPTTDSVAVGGESKSASVTANIAWTASSNQSWLTITSGGSGNGNGTIAYAAAANTGIARSAVITVTGSGLTATLTVSQGAVGAPAISPTTAIPASSGGPFSASVTAVGAWTSASNQTWLTITSGLSGSGNGTINYTVAANTGAARSGTITVTGAGGTATLTVNQAAPVATLSVNPTSQSVNAVGGAFSTAVTASGAWTATPDVAWLTINSGGSGTGNGTINYTAAANSTTAARTGHINVTSGSLTATLTVTEDKPDFTVTGNKPGYTGADRCLVDGSAGPVTVWCLFDAGPIGPASAISSYNFQIDGASPISLGTARVLTNPTIGCGFTVTGNVDFTASIKLTVTTTTGSTVIATRPVLIGKQSCP
jgi:Viral BACON domain/Putative binding domain, N-terminal